MTLFPRAKRSHDLTMVLVALLAFPANLPIVAREAGRGDLEASCHAPGHPGRCFRKSDGSSRRHLAEWSVDADNAEGWDGRDDSRYVLLAMPRRWLDLPSLIPSPLPAAAPDPSNPPASSLAFIPLRC